MIKQRKPFQAVIPESQKADLESLARADGVRRGLFFDTSGRLRAERVSASAAHSWIFQTVAGSPFVW